MVGLVSQWFHLLYVKATLQAVSGRYNAHHKLPQITPAYKHRVMRPSLPTPKICHPFKYSTRLLFKQTQQNGQIASILTKPMAQNCEFVPHTVHMPWSHDDETEKNAIFKKSGQARWQKYAQTTKIWKCALHIGNKKMK